MIENEITIEEPNVINTTIGELICAIADAAKEACVDERELNNLTHQILLSVLKRYGQ